jgi:hypothetical protein
METPASAIRRPLDEITDSQIATLARRSCLTDDDLTKYRKRSAQIQLLDSELEWRGGIHSSRGRLPRQPLKVRKLLSRIASRNVPV